MCRILRGVVVIKNFFGGKIIYRGIHAKFGVGYRSD